MQALAIKQVHKDVKCFVITLSAREVATRRKNDDLYAGLDGFIIANSGEFDDLVAELLNKEFQIAGSVPIVKTNDKRYDADKFLASFDLEFID